MFTLCKLTFDRLSLFYIGKFYSIVWDNTQKLVSRRDQSRDKKNNMMLWANAYAAQSRVGFNDPLTNTTVPASEIPLTSYLPNTNDYEWLVDRMALMVGRVVCRHIAFFKDHMKNIPTHIPHDYTMESSYKSDLVRHLIKTS